MVYRRYKRSYRPRRRAFRRLKKGSVKVQQLTNPAVTTKGGLSGLYQSAGRAIMRQAGPGAAMKALALGKACMGMLNAEKKYYDITNTTVTPATPAGTYTTVSLVGSLTTGDGPSNRDGSQIRLKSMQLQMQFTQNAAATGSTTCRWLLFLDRRVQVASTPSYTDIYDSTDVTNTFLNIEDQWKRFKILRSGLVTLTAAEVRTMVDVYLPCSLPIRYNTADQVVMNNIWLMIVSNETTNTPSVQYWYRIRFYDN